MTNTIFNSKVRKIFSVLTAAGATDVLAVGGSVRDELMGCRSKDIDIEVYGLSYESIIKALRPVFSVNLVGRSFGVLKIGSTIDVALPRRESKSGSGHRGFDVESVPNLSLEEAFARRDFTINAMGRRADGSLVDLFGGRQDLERKILRACSEAFKDDPLRVLRAMQFSARFGFSVSPETIVMCRAIRHEFSTLSPERLWDEWRKWARQGKYPSRGLDVLAETDWVDCFPELAAVYHNKSVGTPCSLWEDTRRRCDAVVACFSDMQVSMEAWGDTFDDDDREVLLLAALALNFSEAGTNEHNASETAAGFLEKLKAPIQLTKRVAALVRACSRSTELPDGDSATARNVRHLAFRLDPASIPLWCSLQEARLRSGDFSVNRAENISFNKFESDAWLRLARECHVLTGPAKPLVLGRHLIELGIRPGPCFTPLLERAYRWQLDGEITTCEEGLARLKQEKWFIVEKRG